MNVQDINLPPLLQEKAQWAWEQILERAGDPLAGRLGEVFAVEPLATQLPRVLACSEFVSELARRKPELLLDLAVSGDLQKAACESSYNDTLQGLLEETDADLAITLRQFRQRHMLRIIWRDLTRLAKTAATVRDTSCLADACITQALQHTQSSLEQRYGVPHGRDSAQAQHLIVLAMGKLGAGELNVSSDIDLIFAYPEAGQTDSPENAISNEEFFTHVGRGLIAALDQVTAEGFVFRVDMRLRPYGDSGALVHNFAALEGYYQEQGRDWERYALIKARAVTGDPLQQKELMDSLRPFVFRRYIDFGVIDSLRSMKNMIATEERRRGLQDNIKLGQGGIREVEFIAQCFQLIRGGRDLGLQQRELLPVLAECAALDCLPYEAVAELIAAYLFLRDTEHAIQGYQDKQTQELPRDEIPRLALAAAMDYADWDSYLAALRVHRDKVHGHFADLIAPPQEEASQTREQLEGVWGEGLSAEGLGVLGYAEPEASCAALQDLQNSSRVVALQVAGRERLDQFMPQLIGACAEVERPDLALQRIMPLVLAVARRSAYLVLLMENPPALQELVVLCAASPWISEQMARNPSLLDELLDRASLYTAPDKSLLQDELRQQVARLPLDDLEAQMNTLRYFKASHVLRVAASELVGRLPLMQVSDKLTWIAEVILEQVLAVAWADLVKKYGEPSRSGQGKGFAVFAYGKLGGLELGYSSDLDLVFIHAGDSGSTNGERAIDNVVFYTRLGQRVIHILETRMPMGQLYEVDMRLRPSGESGMLVSTIAGFENYQQSTAWTWEHQALVRARFVAGDEQVALGVEVVREKILRLPRDEASLAQDVCAMRDKMRKHLLGEAKVKDGEFHLKQGLGGIVDIEFMVQYAVLAWSCSESELVRWSDNVRILQTLSREGFFEQSECEALTQAYLAYRSAAHQLSLQQLSDVASADSFVDARAAVTAKWQQLFAQVALPSQPNSDI